MPKMIISLDGVVIREVQLTKDLTTLGRRPYNDVVLDNPSVSGEHAAVRLKGQEIYIEDLQSTNGTYVNGAPIATSLVRGHDAVEIARYQIKLLTPGTLAATCDEAEPAAWLKVLHPAGHDRPLPLVKVVTTFGKQGLVVAAITRQGSTYLLSRVEGSQALTLNGQPLLAGDAMTLKNQDLVELGGSQLQFFRV